MNLYYINLMIMYLIEEGIKNLDLEKNPIYVHFLNHSTNNVPHFLSEKKEVCIVLQRQFEDIEIDYKYLSVTLSINDERYRFNIDISTIVAINIIDITKLEFEPRINTNYTRDIENIVDSEYIEEMTQKIISLQKFLKNISIGLIPRQINEKNEKETSAKKISIDDTIKNKS